MATKAELEKEVSSLKRSNNSLKGQITKLKKQLEEAQSATVGY